MKASPEYLGFARSRDACVEGDVVAHPPCILMDITIAGQLAAGARRPAAARLRGDSACPAFVAHFLVRCGHGKLVHAMAR